MGRKKVVLSDFNFNKIVDLVEKGNTIDDALKKINFTRSKFYRLASKEQKEYLKKIKSTQRTAFNYSLKNEYNL